MGNKLTLIGARDDLSRNWRALDILVDPCESEVVGCLFGASCNINNAGLDTDMLWELSSEGI